MLLDFINATYDTFEWPGVVVMMAIESAGIPLPSELIMPLAGWMLVKDRGHGEEWLLLAALFGAVGNTIGSLAAYYVGAWGGRPLVEKYGKYILISRHDLDLADLPARDFGFAGDRPDQVSWLHLVASPNSKVQPGPGGPYTPRYPVRFSNRSALAAPGPATLVR